MKILNTAEVLLADLKRYPGNPRKHDLSAIKRSLERNGQYRAIVVRKNKMTILAGHGTVQAASELGWPKMLAHLVQVSDEQARRIVLVDNRTNDLASYDDQLLAGLLGDLPDLDGTGFDDDALRDLLDRLELVDQPDTAPGPLPAKARTKPGELVELGPHRLLCGDAADPEDLARLMDGTPARCMWTDPPYGVDYVGKTKQKLKISGDTPAIVERLLRESFAAADTVLEPGSALYVAHPAGALSVAFARCFLDQGWRLHETLVWVKDTMVLGHSDYHYRHEPILYGYTQTKARRGRGGAGWYGDNKQTSVLEVGRPKASREHPTSKPVELIERTLRNSTRRDSAVLDPFAGSGSTLIACENLHRRAYLIDIDPRYCDVICDRWKRHSQKTAQRP